jgi:hypothetical protein
LKFSVTYMGTFHSVWSQMNPPSDVTQVTSHVTL